MQRVSEEIYKRIDNNIYERDGYKWWQTDSSLNLIRTFFNPVRLNYTKKIFEQYEINPEEKCALEVGCGGGLFCEEISKLGFSTTGIDPSQQSIISAINHAKQSDLPIQYITGTGESLPLPNKYFDVVFCCDVLEHVQDLPRVISEISRVLKPGGIFIYDTINRTMISKLVVIKVLQKWKPWAIMPANLHVWDMFIRPNELKSLLRQNNLVWKEHRGIKPDISVYKILSYLHQRASGKLSYEEFGSKFHLIEGRLLNVSYIGYAIKNDN
jgi:2-polyprenyl-6-hydroxyphenyl methylase / 3-demethylubiquinone-9 3-methyltransferase